HDVQALGGGSPRHGLEPTPQLGHDVDRQGEEQDACPARRARFDSGTRAAPNSARSRHQRSTPLVTSMTESIPNPVSATEPAARPATIAITPSSALYPTVTASSTTPRRSKATRFINRSTLGGATGSR